MTVAKGQWLKQRRSEWPLADGLFSDLNSDRRLVENVRRTELVLGPL